MGATGSAFRKERRATRRQPLFFRSYNRPREQARSQHHSRGRTRTRVRVRVRARARARGTPKLLPPKADRKLGLRIRPQSAFVPKAADIHVRAVATPLLERDQELLELRAV